MTQESHEDSRFGIGKSDATVSSEAPRRSAASGASRVFREFKWGLLTLVLLMIVVVALVYEGGRKRTAKPADEAADADKELISAEGAASGEAIGVSQQTGQPPAAQDPAAAARTDAAPAWDTAPPTRERTQAATAAPAAGTAAQANAGTQSSPPSVPVTAVAPAEEPAQAYTVQAGDSLVKIARQFYGAERASQGAKAIAAANASVVKDANMIRPGMALKIPAFPADKSATNSAGRPGPTPTAGTPGRQGSAPASAHAASEEDGKSVYVVQNGDSLEGIAQKLLKDRTRWKEIAKANNIAGTRIRAGQKLVVAVDAPSQSGRTAP